MSSYFSFKMKAKFSAMLVHTGRATTLKREVQRHCVLATSPAEMMPGRGEGLFLS